MSKTAAAVVELPVRSLSAWRLVREDPVPMSWSELAPPVLPIQIVIAIELAADDGPGVGVAGGTRYLEPDRIESGLVSNEALAQWLGADAANLGATRSERPNPYDPLADPTRVILELAMLDALGRQTGLPAASFLGGAVRSQVDAYASLPSFTSSDAAVSEALAARKAGFRAIKFHAAGLLDADIKTIVSARAELGPETILLWDGSCAYDLPGAISVAKKLAEQDYLWFEAPMKDDAGPALRQLAREVGIPLVPDGMVPRSLGDWVDDLTAGIWSALRLDVTHASSLAGAVRLVRLAESFSVPCEIQSFGFPLAQYANLQLMLTTRACRFFEVPFPAADLTDGLADPPRVANGIVHAPERPGLGHDVLPSDFHERATLLASASIG